VSGFAVAWCGGGDLDALRLQNRHRLARAAKPRLNIAYLLWDGCPFYLLVRRWWCLFGFFAAISPTIGVGEISTVWYLELNSRAYRRYTVRPTAVPMRAALNAVETIEPASVRRRFAGGSSTWTQTKRCVDMGQNGSKECGDKIRKVSCAI